MATRIPDARSHSVANDVSVVPRRTLALGVYRQNANLADQAPGVDDHGGHETATTSPVSATQTFTARSVGTYRPSRSCRRGQSSCRNMTRSGPKDPSMAAN